jgi:type II secretion system protein H
VQTKTLTAGNRGFTLLELLFVLLIIGLTAAVVTISTGRLRDKTRFNQEARRLYQTVKHAREISLMERKNIEVRIDDEGTQYWIYYGDDKSSELHSLPQKFSVTGDTVIFFPKGNSSGGSIKINDGKGQEYHIEIDPVLGIASIKRI